MKLKISKFTALKGEIQKNDEIQLKIIENINWCMLCFLTFEISPQQDVHPVGTFEINWNSDRLMD